ncbi:glycosyltransferase [Mycobacterium sp. M23085]|uniref:glycosyltransferase n=1 Tax=Mycobacterium sp. M23085 TaxID=3378087 RepID=UPI003878412C
MPSRYDAAAVVIPVHNELAQLPRCLRAVLTAALCAPIPVKIVVVLDGCDDGSDELAGEYGPDVHFIKVDVHHLGTARAVGFNYARSLFRDDHKVWFATTDADSRVDSRWLVHQLRSGADVGFEAPAYRHVGGFRTLPTGEKADLVERFEPAGHRIHRHTELSVIPPARTGARTLNGVDHLRQLGRSAAGDCA